MDNNSKSVSDSSCNSQDNDSSDSKLGKGLGLENISYADYIILSSTLSYAIAEELTDTDLDMLIVFAGMIASDLALLRTKRGIIKGKKAASQAIEEQNQDAENEAIIGGVEGGITGDVSTTLTRNKKRHPNKKIKKVKKKRIKKTVKR